MEKQRWEEYGRVRKEKRRREKIRERKSRKKEDAGARKGRKVAIHCVFPNHGGSKSRLAKTAGAEPSGQMRDEKVHAVVAGSNFEVKTYKAHHSRSTFKN